MLGLREYQTLCSTIPEAEAEEIFRRLPERYFEVFDPPELAKQAHDLVSLSTAKNFVLRIEAGAGDEVVLTICAFDYPGEFAILTGLLGSTGFHIRRGNIFTFSQLPSDQPLPRFGRNLHRDRRRFRVVSRHRRKIVDRFVGVVEPGTDPALWRQELDAAFSSFFRLLAEDSPDAHARARSLVLDRVALALGRNPVGPRAALLPVLVTMDRTEPSLTRMKVESEDTPFFLYSLSSALSLHRLSIETVVIETIGNRIVDVFDFAWLDGRPVVEAEELDALRFSVLFTKQFTYFIDLAPDPQAAFLRFEAIIQELHRSLHEKRISTLLHDPRILQDLARLLGASDFLWEDFIRVQYEALLSVLPPAVEGRLLSMDAADFAAGLASEVENASDGADAKRRLNEFKDREIFRIDLDHILHPELGLRFLSRRLTDLAACVLTTALAVAEKELASVYGGPKTAAGLTAEYALFGLGKFGGEALGYASDIEVLFVYGDSGRTEGPESITNEEFFERLFFNAQALIDAKRDGIFHLDLRLRPYGKSGPLACSLGAFCAYFGPDGPALAYERLALVRLRFVCGGKHLGAQVERIRDDLVYGSSRVEIAQIKSIREDQISEMAADRRLNAKFSPGCLVDIEYTVQLLQVLHGKNNPGLRTPRVHEALEALVALRVVDRAQADAIVAAYHFFRTLINGLRMLRGNAKDLYLPADDSQEYLHLARRIGYTGKDRMSAAEELRIDLAAYSAEIRRFMEEYLGGEAASQYTWGSIADLVLSPNLIPEVTHRILADGNLADLRRAEENIRLLAADHPRAFAPLAVLAWDYIRESADPDMALNYLERFVAAVPDREALYTKWLRQPGGLAVLVQVAAVSRFLADTLVDRPDFLDWVSKSELVQRPRSPTAMREDLADLTIAVGDWRRAVRLFRRREILRIGIRDLVLGVTVASVTSELAGLAETILDFCLDALRSETEPELAPGGMVLLAFGKLGGRELNYSSDLDLVALYDGDRETALPPYLGLLSAFVNEIGRHTADGTLYRLDFRLRPFGRSGRLCVSAETFVEYYRRQAEAWEFQALLKLRPVAGCPDLGKKVMTAVGQLLRTGTGGVDAQASMRRMRAATVRRLDGRRLRGLDIKNDYGGIRDIEFLIQALQLEGIASEPALFEGNTATAVDALVGTGRLDKQVAAQLKRDYNFLRRVEHFLQIFEDRQTHQLPQEPAELAALARRIIGRQATGPDLLEELRLTMSRVLATNTSLLGPITEA